MIKTKSFSIYLLKDGFDQTNTLKEDHKLDDQITGNDLPEGATLYVLDNDPHPPWWKSYFGIEAKLNQVLKGAIIFLPVNGRTFAITFGHVYHNLNDTSYEYDFGLRVTLNCVDPEKLKSTDILEPSGAKRQRTQLPVDSDLTYFDFDRDSTILKSLTGKVKDEHKKLFKHATGASNIRISSDVTPDGLPDLCAKLLDLYNDDAYKTAFPEIQNISPVRDPVIVDALNVKLLEAVHEKNDDLALTIPEIINYQDGLWATFSGAGGGLIYDDVYMARYFEYLDAHNVDLANIDIQALKKHSLVLTDEDGKSHGQKHSILKCLVFDTVLDTANETYHLSEGNWYLVDTDYIAKLTTYLDPLCADTGLDAFDHDNEGAYNTTIADASEALICLDKKSIAPKGQKQVEPCDIFELSNGKAVLHHVKRSTLSRQLSHLFNQGVNSVKLLRSDTESMSKMKALVEAGAPEANKQEYIKPLENDSLKVVFEIITHKDKDDKSLNLPLFSRISLMRCMKELKMMSIEAEYCFVDDKSPKNAGKKKKRKPRKKNDGDAAEAQAA
jgi:uncharacterized protein (TIGR04141 family)